MVAEEENDELALRRALAFSVGQETGQGFNAVVGPVNVSSYLSGRRRVDGFADRDVTPSELRAMGEPPAVILHADSVDELRMPWRTLQFGDNGVGEGRVRDVRPDLFT